MIESWNELNPVADDSELISVAEGLITVQISTPPEFSQTWLLETSYGTGGNALTTGLDGSIYMAGWTQGNLAGEMNRGYSDGFIAKYETDGALAWTRLLASNDWDGANALTTRIDGSIYIAGYTRGNLNGEINNGASDAFMSRVIVDGTVAEPVPPPEFIDPLLPLNGDYIPIAGDFNGSGITDILWYAPGPDPDFMWYFNQDGNYDSFQLTVNGHYAPFPADLEVF